MKIKIFLGFLVFTLFFVCGSFAETFKWVDEHGNIHFTDNVFNIPKGVNVSSLGSYKDNGSNREDTIPLEKVHAGSVVRVLLNGVKTARLVLDTGATATVITPAVLESIGATIKMSPPVDVLTAGGRVKAGWAEVEKLEVGGRAKKGMRVIALDAIEGVDGLLGMDFLGNYRVEIIKGGKTMKLTPQ